MIIMTDPRAVAEKKKIDYRICWEHDDRVSRILVLEIGIDGRNLLILFLGRRNHCSDKGLFERPIFTPPARWGRRGTIATPRTTTF